MDLDYLARNLVNELKIKCTIQNCIWTGCLETHESHLKDVHYEKFKEKIISVIEVSDDESIQNSNEEEIEIFYLGTKKVKRDNAQSLNDLKELTIKEIFDSLINAAKDGI